MKKVLLGGLCFLLAAGVIIYRTQKSSTEGTSKFLEISFYRELASLDPGLAHNYPGSIVVKMSHEGLMRRGFNGSLVPGVAESYEVSPDQKTYTFHLRPSMWSNGDPVTAYDFEYAWKRVVNPALPTTGTLNFYPIKNVEAVVKNEKGLDAVGVRAVDERTLVVELEYPAPYFLESTSCASYAPVHRSVEGVSNGPFAVKEWQEGHSLTLVKNPYYWDAGQVHLPGIHVQMIVDSMTNLLLFKKGNLDWLGKPISGIPFEAIPTMQKEKKLHRVSGVGVLWYFLNTEVFPFHNKKVRQAFAYAINRKELAEHLFLEGETPAMSILPGSLCVSKKPYFADGDLKRARQLFAEALQEMGKKPEDFSNIVLSCPKDSMHESVAQVVQRQWSQAFGVKIRIATQDWKILHEKLTCGDYQIGAMGWLPFVQDPIYMLKTFKYRADGINKTRWQNPRYIELLDASDDELDPEKRKEIFRQAETLLMEEMPVIPISFMTNGYAKNPHLLNVCVSEFGDIDFKWAYFDDQK